MTDGAPMVRDLTGGKGAKVFYDGVGASTFESPAWPPLLGVDKPCLVTAIERRYFTV